MIEDIGVKDNNVDWDSVPVDTKVIVTGVDGSEWNCHFCKKYDWRTVLVFHDGKTSWTATKTQDIYIGRVEVGMIDKTSYGLKRCPFCGSKSIHINGNKKRYASCYTCGARTKNSDTTKEAIKRWNERVSCQELLR